MRSHIRLFFVGSDCGGGPINEAFDFHVGDG